MRVAERTGHEQLRSGGPRQGASRALLVSVGAWHEQGAGK